MRDDPRVVLWGEDVSIGVMGPTRGLAAEFGPSGCATRRSRRQGFVGAAVGAAMGGLRPVVDLMFASFAYVCLDQVVNQAGRIRSMTGGQVAGAARRSWRRPARQAPTRPTTRRRRAPDVHGRRRAQRRVPVDGA